MITSPLSLAASLGIFLALRYLLKIGHRPAGLPPGPPTLPIIGNLHQIPFENRHLQFEKWARQYGPIYSLILGTTTVIVLSSDEAVKDLLDKKGKIYSSRPYSYISNVASGGMHFAMMPYNDTWKMCHRVFNNSITERAARTYLPFQELENKQMLNSILEAPAMFRAHIRRYTYSLTVQMVFGFRAARETQEDLLQLYDGFGRWQRLMGQALTLIVDLYPILRFLPDFLLPIRRYAKWVHKKQLALFLGFWHRIKTKIQKGTAQPCFAEDMLKEQSANGVSNELASYICGVLLIAGSDTTGAELVAFVQAMLLYPEVQKTAQAEIDKICGDRLPTIEDANSIPYIRCLIKETCRWMPTPILGIPHCVMQDDEYKGYRIPKNATVIYNVWGIHMDPQRHPDPRRFDPSRYQHDKRSSRESALCDNPAERDHFLFGAGRRLCMGMEIAENSFALAFSRILWAFNISKATDEHGNEITPDPEALVGGLAASPKPFPAKISPRSEQRAQAVRNAWELAQAALNESDKQWKDIPPDLAFGRYKPRVKA